MGKSRSLGEIYSDLESKSSDKGRKIHRLCEAVDYLDREKPNIQEISKLLGRFKNRRDTAKSVQSYVEYQMLCVHLFWLGSIQKVEAHDSEYQLFMANADNDGLLSRRDENLSCEDTLTFSLQSHERQASAEQSHLGNFRRDIFDSASADAFFPRIVEILETRWVGKSIGVSQRSLDAHHVLRNRFLEFMHKQLLQNALCHAIADSTFNKKYNRFYRERFSTEGDDYLFGVLAYLDVQLLDPNAMDETSLMNELLAIHPRFAKDESWVHSKLKLKKKRILVFSYCDTGPGIERHITNFCPSKEALPKKFDIKYVLDNRITGRDTIGAGLGLNDIRQLARTVSAKFVIETPRTIYLDDYSNKLEHSTENKRLFRGTSATILLEV